DDEVRSDRDACGRLDLVEETRQRDRIECVNPLERAVRNQAIRRRPHDASQSAENGTEQGCVGGFGFTHPATLSASARRAIFPVAVRGSTSTTRIRGTMYPGSCARDQVSMSTAL